MIVAQSGTRYAVSFAGALAIVSVEAKAGASQIPVMILGSLGPGWEPAYLTPSQEDAIVGSLLAAPTEDCKVVARALGEGNKVSEEYVARMQARLLDVPTERWDAVFGSWSAEDDAALDAILTKQAMGRARPKRRHGERRRPLPSEQPDAAWPPQRRYFPDKVVKADDLESYWDEVREKLFDPWESEYAKKYISLVRSLQTNAVARARQGKLFGLDSWQETFRAGMRRVYRSCWLASRRQFLSDTEARSLKASPRRGLEVEASRVVRRLNERVELMLDTIYNGLERIFDKAEDEEWDKEELAEVVDEFFGGYLTGGKVGLIARTEVATTVNAARAFEMDARGVARSYWVTAKDNRVRKTHRIYGRAGAMPSGFNWAKLVRKRYVLRRPHDELCTEISEVANCRCILVPADIEEAGIRHKRIVLLEAA